MKIIEPGINFRSIYPMDWTVTYSQFRPTEELDRYITKHLKDVIRHQFKTIYYGILYERS